MKYKIGDKVRIKSLDWYNENKNHYDEIPLFKPRGLFVPDMSRYCNNIMTIKDICYGTCYRMKEDFWNYNWTDEMIERLVEEEITIDLTVKGEDVNERIEIAIPEGYEYAIESGKIIFTKKKKEYPKTYDECCEIVKVGKERTIEGEIIRKNNYKIELLESFQKLLICRDAYWKIAGDEMGLGKPWEPDWNDTSIKYCLERDFDAIDKNVSNHKGRTFAFPTEEMRDAFYENFKELIESVKELL